MNIKGKYDEIIRQKRGGSHIKIDLLNLDKKSNEKTVAWIVNEWEQGQIQVGCQFQGAGAVVPTGLVTNPESAARIYGSDGEENVYLEEKYNNLDKFHKDCSHKNARNMTYALSQAELLTPEMTKNY